MAASENTTPHHPDPLVLEFITIAQEPSQAAKDDTFKKRVKSNASRLVQRVRGTPGEHASVDVAPAATLAATDTPHGVRFKVPGRSRFALGSRKPMTRIRHRDRLDLVTNETQDRIQISPAVGLASVLGGYGSECCVSLEHFKDPQGSSYEIVPKHSSIAAKFATICVPQTSKFNIEMMLHHLFQQLIDHKYESSNEVFADFDDLYTRHQAIFHASLCIAAVSYDTGKSDLYHCQQTMQVVSERLNDAYNQTGDETLGAVGLLIIYNTLKGSLEIATLHMNGLESMIAARGGLEHLPFRLRRTLSMIDTFYATTFDTRPRYPFVALQKSPEDTCRTLKYTSSYEFRILGLSTQSGLCLRMNEVLQVLRLMTTCRFDEPISVVSRLALSDAIYHLEWELFSSQEPPETSPAHDLEAKLQKSFHLATVLYIDMVLREMPSFSYQGLVNRLVDTLQTCFQNASVVDIVQSAHRDIFLWILFIGAVATKDDGQRQYFTEWLWSIRALKGCQSRAEFEAAIDTVGPGLQSFGKQIVDLWDKMPRFD